MWASKSEKDELKSAYSKMTDEGLRLYEKMCRERAADLQRKAALAKAERTARRRGTK